MLEVPDYSPWRGSGHEEFHLGGRGIVLAPSLFCGTAPQLFAPGSDAEALLIYPAPRAAAAIRDIWLPPRSAGSHKALAALLGTTRAAGLAPQPRDSGRVSGNLRRPRRYHRGLLRATHLRGWSASDGPRWLMVRSAADFEIPNNGSSCRNVRFVRQYEATSGTRSSRGRLQGRPLPTGSAPSHCSALISLLNCPGFSPENGAIQVGSDAVTAAAM